MAKQRYRVRNWNEYNKALINRGSLTFWFSPEVIENWQSKKLTSQRGRPRYYSEMAILCGLTVRQLFRLPLRTTEGLIQSIINLLAIPVKVPDYSTLCRRGKSLEVNLNVQPKGDARHVLVDATGIQVIGEGEWKKLKHGEARCQVWRKLHLTMDANEHLILSAEMTESVRLDGNYLPGLLDKIKGKIERVIGDGAYDKKGCYRAIYQRGAKPIIPPQHNAIVQRNKWKKDPALNLRDEVITYLGKDEREEKLKEWKQENGYHKRSLIETMMFRMKTLFGDQMRSRCWENQRTDLLIRCYAMNKITSLGLPKSERIL